MDKRNEGFTSTRVLALMLSGALVCGAGLSAFASDDAMSAFAEDEAVTSSYEAVESEENAPGEDALAFDIVTEGEDSVETEEPDIEIIPEDEPEEQVTEVVSEEESAEENEPEYDPEEEIIEEFFELEETNPLYEDLVLGDLPDPEVEENAISPDVADFPWAYLIEKAAPEFQSLSREQLARYREIWIENAFVYNTMPEMMALYADVGGLSPDAQFAMYLANAWFCAEFTKEYYVGNEAYLAAFDALCETYYALAALTDVDADMETMYAAYADGIEGLNDLKDAENEQNGGETFTDVFIAYGFSYQAASDVDTFFAAMGL